jgi:hypothetical protein
MTPEEMAADAAGALAAGTNVTLVLRKGQKMPQKFPRGELLCENFDGSRCYSYSPLKVLAWLNRTGLVKVTATVAPNARLTAPDTAHSLRRLMNIACILEQRTYNHGDPPPDGYLAWHEWAAVQHKAGLRQRQCCRCGLWNYPQELSADTDECTDCAESLVTASSETAPPPTSPCGRSRGCPCAR